MKEDLNRRQKATAWMRKMQEKRGGNGDRIKRNPPPLQEFPLLRLGSTLCDGRKAGRKGKTPEQLSEERVGCEDFFPPWRCLPRPGFADEFG